MKTLRRIILILLIVLAIVIGRSRLASSTPSPHFPPVTLEMLASGTMPQYRNSPYWSREFVYAEPELMRDYGTLDNHGVPAFKDATLTGYTIRDYYRVTSDQPEHFDRTVWVFGSSTVWGAYVDDAHTIPSYLQREFNRMGLQWRVVNSGQPSIPIATEYYWLTQAKLQRGDLVIFIDGAVNLNAILKADDTVDSYRKVIGKARQYAQAHGAAFSHFMQPEVHDLELYAALCQNDTIFTIPDDSWFDEYHYDDAAHATIAAQIVSAIWQTF